MKCSPVLSQVILLILVLLTYSGCKDDGPSFDERFAEEQIQIEEYINQNGLIAEKLSSGLHIVEIKKGEGDSISGTNLKIEVGYRGSLLNGEVFDQTPSNNPTTFSLSNLIEGWKEGLQGMQTGGVRMLLVPSHLGYGEREFPDIPPHSVLVFEIELLAIIL